MNRDEDRERRIAWWREAKFGMFIHWGLYSLPAGEWKGTVYDGIGEWIMFKARIPVAEYEELAASFNPTAFDADAWADLARDAGMKYLVITAKHHDGFAMFKSTVSRFNIVDATPFGRDPVAELATACAKRGIEFGVYYSQAQDWHAPGGAVWASRHENGPLWEKLRWDPRQEGDFDDYLETKAIPQVRELLTNYGPLALIWFDTPLDVMTNERAAKLEQAVHELQGDALVSGRIGGKSVSDYDSEGDNRIPDRVREGDWETPATLNDTWGYKKHDTNWKRSDDIVFKLVDIVSKGGNYLLNVGPDSFGRIPGASVQILREVGEWMRACSEAIYGSGPTPFGSELAAKTGPRYRLTTRPGRLYVHLFEHDGRPIELPEAGLATKRVRLLGPETSADVRMTGTQNGVTLSIPAATQTMPITICLE